MRIGSNFVNSFPLGPVDATNKTIRAYAARKEERTLQTKYERLATNQQLQASNQRHGDVYKLRSDNQFKPAPAPRFVRGPVKDNIPYFDRKIGSNVDLRT